MSVLRPLLSRRGRLALLAISLLLIGALVAAPSVSGAKAAVKQFTATITPNTAVGGVLGTWTERVKNCGTPVAAPCTASSTIAIGRVRITVPSEFRDTITIQPTVVASNGSTWSLIYDPVAGTITAQPANGSNKLNSGEFVDIPFSATPDITETCIFPTTFTTTAIGGLPSGPDTQTFSIVGPQPSLALGCTDPDTGQTDTVTGDFQGHVNVTFGGATGNCGGPEFGAVGDQWQVYHQPTPSTLTPASDFIAGVSPKVWTTEFPLLTPPDGPDGDSSWYLTCYAVPQDGHTRFVSRGTVDGLAVDQEIPPGSGVHFWVGILASCANAPIPCVSEQFLTTGPTPPGPPWNPSDNRVHIAIRVDPGDPHRS